MADASRASYFTRQPNYSRQDYLIGIACSLLLHGSVFFSDYFFPSAKIPTVRKPAEEPILQMEMPLLPPDEPEEVIALDAGEDSAESLAPPTLEDIPRMVPVDAFVQPLSPPRPTGLVANTGMISIPTGRTGSTLGKGMKDLFDINQLDQAPQLRSAIPPDYPYQLRDRSITGRVTVEFIVDYNGNVVAVQVVGSTHEDFERPAMRAVSKWKFRPGRKAGRTVNSRVQQVITFNLEDR